MVLRPCLGVGGDGEVGAKRSVAQRPEFLGLTHFGRVEAEDGQFLQRAICSGRRALLGLPRVPERSAVEFADQRNLLLLSALDEGASELVSGERLQIFQTLEEVLTLRALEVVGDHLIDVRGDARATAAFSDALRTAFPLLAYGFLATLSAWALLTRYSSMRDEAVARLRATELEQRLSETETLLAAEPHLLFIWNGNDGMPDRVGGSLPDVKGVPEKHEDWVYFPKWLDIASAETLSQGLASLKLDGTAFNFVVRTRADELLEADGRTAGGLATLRLRRLTGERLEMSQVAQQYRMLEQRAAMLTAILDQAPMPVWVRNHERAITWANRAYLNAVEAGGVGDVVEHKLELIESAQRRRAQQELSAKSVVRQRTHAVMAGERKNVDVIDVAFEGGSAGFAIDMTDLEEAQNELRRHIQAHASTLDKLATAVAIFGADQRIRFYNAAYASLWSLDIEWLNEQPSDSEILDVLREARSLPEQADYRAWKTRQLEAYTRVEPHEDWWHLPDGQTLRVISEQHPFGGVTYLYENVTERIELERGLQRTDQRPARNPGQPQRRRRPVRQRRPSQALQSGLSGELAARQRRARRCAAYRRNHSAVPSAAR